MKLERLCCYDVQGSTSVARGRKPRATISRPAVAEKRLSLTPNGNVRYQLKTPYRESLPREQSECFGHDTTHVIFEPLDFIVRLAALAPKTLALLAGWALACIEDPLVVETTAGMQEVEQRREQLPKILNHLDAKAAEPEAMRRPPCRAPPPAGAAVQLSRSPNDATGCDVRGAAMVAIGESERPPPGGADTDG